MSEPRTFTQEQVNNALAHQRREFHKLIAEQQVERGQHLADLDELLDTLGIAVVDGEDTTTAAKRWIGEAEARLAAPAAPQADDHAALVDRADKAEARLRDHQIDQALRNAATGLRAHRPEQVVAMLKPFAKVVGDGEIVIEGFQPTLLQSPSEAVALIHDSVEHANLFQGTMP